MCLEKKQGVTVNSFDGSSYLSNPLNGMIASLNGASEDVRSGSVWQFHHNAVSDTLGTARFTKQGKGQNAGFEGGKLRGAAATADTEEVEMTTIDTFLQKWTQATAGAGAGAGGGSNPNPNPNLKVKQVQVLKIDAEGNDNKVIVGAKRAIEEGVALFTFEGGGGVSFTKEHIADLDARGFSCYSTSRAGLFRWSGGCMSEGTLCVCSHTASSSSSSSSSLSLPRSFKLFFLSIFLSLSFSLYHQYRTIMYLWRSGRLFVCLSQSSSLPFFLSSFLPFFLSNPSLFPSFSHA